MMKKQYNTPEIIVESVTIEQYILAGSLKVDSSSDNKHTESGTILSKEQQGWDIWGE